MHSNADDGRLLVVYNHSWDPDSRKTLALSTSEDFGNTWDEPLIIDQVNSTSPGRLQHCYPAVIQSRDGLVHVTYTRNRGGKLEESTSPTISHLILDPSKL